jgi:4-hydroxy-tetrahydrodipicolinate reductase
MAGSTIRVVVTGGAGSMGRQVRQAVVEAPDLVLAAVVDPSFMTGDPSDAGAPCYSDLEAALAAADADVVVDFTVAQAAAANIATAIAHRVAAVVGTTGIPAGELEDLGRRAEASGVPVFVAPNFAIGAVLMMLFSQQAARHLETCEIVELHHERKLDSPSGTAARSAQMVEEVWSARGVERDVPVHSVRLPGLVAHQEVIFGALGQTLTIRHDSTSRESFMPGVVLAVRRVRDLQGLTVGLENLL